MKRLITIDDFVDVKHKLKQRGLGFLISKFNLKGIKRTEKTFNQQTYESADWWIIPKVRQRWNLLITGNPELEYKKYFIDTFLQNKQGIKLLSLGSGSAHHEIELAQYSNFEEIVCVDIAKDIVQNAEKTAAKLNLKNIKFICADANSFDIPKEYFDIVFFHSSLHHFDKLDRFIPNKIKQSLKENGLLIINEYVGQKRLQFSKNQIKKINEALNLIPEKYKIRYKSGLLKTKFYGPGILRMIIADPSECIDSDRILPVIHSNFHTIVEKPYGGNILMSVLKDISHHFVDLNPEKNNLLEKLFSLEDEYLKNNPSDFVFGIYQKRNKRST